MKNKVQITIFTGVTVDGKITLNKNISSKSWGQFIPKGAIDMLQQMRQKTDAVMVGGRTIALDNPTLLRSDLTGYRIIVDNSGKLEKNINTYKVFNNRPKQTFVLTSQKAPDSYIKKLKQKNIDVHQSNADVINFYSALLYLAQKNIRHIMLEGGGTLNAVILRLGLVQKIVTVIFPFIVGGSLTPTLIEGQGSKSLTDIINLKLIKSEIIDSCIVNTYKVL